MLEAYGLLAIVGIALFVLMVTSLPVMAIGALLNKYIKDGELAPGAMLGFMAWLVSLFICVMTGGALTIVFLMLSALSNYNS